MSRTYASAPRTPRPTAPTRFAATGPARWSLLPAAALLGLACGVLAPRALAQEDDGRPDIVMIVLDDMGYADLGAFGDARSVTPHIDAFARSGMRFTNFHAAAPNCSPTRASVLTGMYPHRLGLSELLDERSHRGIPPEFETFPQLLRERGYRTAHFGKWHVGRRHARHLPPAKGFDESAIFKRGRGYRDPEFLVDGERVERVGGHLTERITDRALAFLRSPQPGPKLLSVWHYAPHAPYEPPKRWAKRYPRTRRGRYRALLAHADEQIGRIVDAVASSDRADDTAIVILSDNGAVRAQSASNRPFVGAKGQLLEGGLRVPLMIRWRGHTEAGTTCTELLSTIDLAPTLLDIGSISGGDERAIATDGRSFRDALAGSDPTAQDRALFWARKDERGTTETRAVWRERWKLLIRKGRRSLFDMSLGGVERADRDRSERHPELVDELQRELCAWRARTSQVPFRVAGTAGAAATTGALDFAFGAGGGTVELASDSRLDVDDGDLTVAFSFTRAPGAADAPRIPLIERVGSWSIAVEAGAVVARFAPSGPGRRRVVLRSRDVVGPPDTPHHVVVSVFAPRGGHGRTQFTLWIDGRRAARARAKLRVALATGPLLLGGHTTQSGVFEGELRDVRFHVAPLAPQELDVR